MKQDLFYDPRSGDPSLRVETCSSQLPLVRSNYFSLYFFEEGHLEFEQGFHRFSAQGPCLCCVNTYQAHGYISKAPILGQRVQFHANFLCLETYHQEVGCNGVLFNQTDAPLAIPVPKEEVSIFRNFIASLQSELHAQHSGKHDALLAYAKLLLIQAARLKLRLNEVSRTASPAAASGLPLHELYAAIDAYYHTENDLAFYAAKLGVSANRLAHALKQQHGTSLNFLLQERKIKEAKWQLLHTDQSVKSLAHAMRFQDEFYFSRWFKKATGLAPSHFRKFEWKIRGLEKSP